MKKITSYIINMVWSERRQNAALFLELLVVSCVMWFLVDYAYCTIKTFTEPAYYHTDHCYRLELRNMPVKTIKEIYHTEELSDLPDERTALRRLMDDIRQMPDVEAVGMSTLGHDMPFVQMMFGECDTIMIPFFFVTPDIVRVFRYESVDGKTYDEMADILERGELLIGDVAESRLSWSPVVGEHRIAIRQDSATIRVGGLIKQPKFRKAYQSSWRDGEVDVFCKMDISDTFFPESGRWPGYYKLFIRVKDGHDRQFEEAMGERMKNYGLHAGTYYGYWLRSFQDIERNMDGDYTAQVQFRIIAMGFLLLNVFLGLLGTFWFRTQRRFPEIGLQKVIGASNRTIVLRLFVEAMLIFIVAFLPSLPIDYAVAQAGLTENYEGTTFAVSRFIACEAITFLLMAVIIGIGLAFPARRAVRANPTDVLRDE